MAAYKVGHINVSARIWVKKREYRVKCVLFLDLECDASFNKKVEKRLISFCNFNF